MPWSKDATSAAPKTIYTAPPEAWPTVQLIHDPNATHPWSVVYGRLNAEGVSDAKADVEAELGLT